MTSALLTTEEAARELRMSQRFVLDELRRKRLRGSKFGGEWRITPDDLETYVQSHANVRQVRKAAS